MATLALCKITWLPFLLMELLWELPVCCDIVEIPRDSPFLSLPQRHDLSSNDCVRASSELRVLWVCVCAQACTALGGELCHPVRRGFYKLSLLEPEQASLSRSSDRAQTGIGKMKSSHGTGSRGIVSKTAGLRLSFALLCSPELLRWGLL